jgi:hypothetical protein
LAFGVKIARAGSQLAPPFVVRVKIASLRKERGLRITMQDVAITL